MDINRLPAGMASAMPQISESWIFNWVCIQWHPILHSQLFNWFWLWTRVGYPLLTGTDWLTWKNSKWIRLNTQNELMTPYLWNSHFSTRHRAQRVPISAAWSKKTQLTSRCWRGLLFMDFGDGKKNGLASPAMQRRTDLIDFSLNSK